MYRVNIEQFEGPLDLLLEIIEQKKLSLINLRLAALAEDFVSYIRTLDSRTPEELANFLVTASRLALLKSRELVPAEDELEDDGSIDELERRLALYQPFREGAQLLQRTYNAPESYWEREAFANHAVIEYIPRTLTADTLAQHSTRALQNVTLPQRIPQAEIASTISIQDCITELEELLSGVKTINFSLFVRTKNKSAQVAHFVGMLELVRTNGTEASQKKPFDTIMLHTAA